MSRAKMALTGSATLVAAALLKRLIGLISTLILARLLVPEDFGIVAVATIVLNFCQVMSETGVRPFIIQHSNLTPQILNVAWTTNLLVKNAFGMAIFLSAPWVAEAYNDVRLTPVLQAISLYMVCNACQSLSFALLMKEQKYGGIFKLEITEKALSVVLAVSLALIYESYWALIIGNLTSAFIKCAGSYFIHPFRPRIAFKGMKKQYQFTGWVIPREMFGYFRSQMDTLMVSSFFGKAQLGSYHVMKYISFMPSSQLITPAAEPLLAEFSRSKDDPEKLSYQFNLSFMVLMLVGLPIATFFVFHSELCVAVLLGSNWLAYSEVFSALSIMILSHMFMILSKNIMTALGQVKYLFYYELVANLMLFGLLWWCRSLSIEQFAYARAFIELVFVMILFTLSGYALKLNLAKQLKFIICVSLVLAAGVSLAELVNNWIENVYLAFFVVGSVFVLVYLAGLLLSFKLFYFKEQEAQHIKYLIVQAGNKVLKRG